MYIYKYINTYIYIYRYICTALIRTGGQALPACGYTPFFAAILAHPNITVRLDADFHTIRSNCRHASRSRLWSASSHTRFYTQTIQIYIH